ncbi:MAG: acetylglutamate kinase [Dehalococcoidales bacterium]|nr:acetylglutamate kinase [Dehalococcoidales bacterium]
MNGIIVIKIGGSTLGSHDTTIEDIAGLQKQGRPVVVVHGGGKLLTEWLGKQGVPSSFLRGERVTDRPTLEVATAVLAGLVNKDITSAINALGGKAVGISGVDGNIIEGEIQVKEKGYVGAATAVHTELIDTLVGAGFVPIIASIGMNASEREEGDPATLNFNADVVAGEIAAAVHAESLIFLTDVEGIKDSEDKVLAELTREEALALIDSGVASSGMIPKINACLKAMTAGAVTRIIDGRQPHALLNELQSKRGGTTFRLSDGNED